MQIYLKWLLFYLYKCPNLRPPCIKRNLLYCRKQVCARKTMQPIRKLVFSQYIYEQSKNSWNVKILYGIELLTVKVQHFRHNLNFIENLPSKINSWVIVLTPSLPLVSKISTKPRLSMTNPFLGGLWIPPCCNQLCCLAYSVLWYFSRWLTSCPNHLIYLLI